MKLDLEDMQEAWAILQCKSVTAKFFPRHMLLTYHCKDHDREVVIPRDEIDAVSYWREEMEERYGCED